MKNVLAPPALPRLTALLAVGVLFLCATPVASAQWTFIRGDHTADGSLQLNDAIGLLSFLFVPGTPAPLCHDASDLDDNGILGLADGIYLLNHLFVPGSPAPPEPFPECGDDPTDDSLDCVGPVAGCPPASSPPEITSTPVTTATVGQLYSYDVEASDPDPGDVISYSLDLAPAGVSIAPDTGLISWTPEASQVGDNDLVVRAEDQGGLFDTQAFTVEVILSADGPVLSNLAAPATVPVGGSATITFDYADPDGDITVLESTRSNITGDRDSVTPASLLDMEGTGGQVTITLDAALLPFGTTTFTLRLRDGNDNLSNEESFTIELVGESSGGSAPSLQNLQVDAPSWDRPLGTYDRIRPTFSYDYADADGDLERLRVHVMVPDGTEQFVEMPGAVEGIEGTSGSVAGHIIAFGVTSPLGSYSVEITPIDRNGNFGSAVSTSVELVASGGEPALSIASFLPTEGPPGTEVVITGSGFDVDVPENNVVTLAEVHAQVTEVTDTTLTVIVPDDTDTGFFAVRLPGAVALAESAFTVPPSVTVLPADPEVIIGATVHQRPGGLPSV